MLRRWLGGIAAGFVTLMTFGLVALDVTYSTPNSGALPAQPSPDETGSATSA